MADLSSIPSMSSIPSVAEMLESYESNDKVRETVHHNVEYFKRIHGGRRMAAQHRIDFDPRAQYWRPPERRILVAYFSKQWHRRYAPAAALRAHALAMFRHFARGREDGVFHEWHTVEYELIGGWEQVARRLVEHAQLFGDSSDWRQLQEVWRIGAKAADHLCRFIERTIEEGAIQSGEPSFASRLPWLPYLDCPNRVALLDRQRFFFAYANLLTSTNAYHVGGALNFASAIQNTPVSSVLDAIDTWPEEVQFKVLTRDIDDMQDIAHHATVIELVGFLNLNQMPFINSKTTSVFRDAFNVDESYALMRSVGQYWKGQLLEDVESVERLRALFDEWISKPFYRPGIIMEGLDSTSAERRARESEEDRIDKVLVQEIRDHALVHIAEMSPMDRAMCAVHLLLDSVLYNRDVTATVEMNSKSGVMAAEPSHPITGQQIVLPVELHSVAEKALAYLKAGMHVLFAGAPGTGKTTLAQIVGYAWNHQLDAPPEQIDLAAAPLTTVGNSAWSPFHTIGGLMPDPTAKGGYAPHAGIFISPGSETGEQWMLRDECIVLDEMNRADLDRCIGELYPLLSDSVAEVHPAGLPGVKSIAGHPQFRIIATINDATLDDIVFPISEGLARRFLRIELPGAAQESVEEYLRPSTADAEHQRRFEASRKAVGEFYLHAAQKEFLESVDESERLWFGVGYFRLLRLWVSGQLVVPPMIAQFDLEQQARMLLRDALATMMRNDKLTKVLAALDER